MINAPIATGFFLAGIVARITRASVLQMLGQDYARTARAKGLAEAARAYLWAWTRTFCGPRLSFLASTTPRMMPSTKRA